MTVQRVPLTSMLHDRAMSARPARSDWSHFVSDCEGEMAYGDSAQRRLRGLHDLARPDDGRLGFCPSPALFTRRAGE